MRGDQGTSLIRNNPLLRPYSGTMSVAIWWPQRGGGGSCARSTPVTSPPLKSFTQTEPETVSCAHNLSSSGENDHVLFFITPRDRPRAGWLNRMDTTRVEDAQGTPTQSHIAPSVRVYEENALGSCRATGSGEGDHVVITSTNHGGSWES